MGMSSDKKVRGFRFFFWVSASLFILAAANWTFNSFIGISNLVSNSFGLGVSNATSYLLGVGILLLAIFLVAAFLNAAYAAVPNVREILNGVLGLDKAQGVQETSTPEAPKESPTNPQQSGIKPKLDKDYQLLKINFAWDYYLGTFLAWTAVFSGALIGVISIIFQAGNVLGFPLTEVLTFLAIVVTVSLYWSRAIWRFQGRHSYVDQLIKKAEDGETLGDLHDIMNEIKRSQHRSQRSPR